MHRPPRFALILAAIIVATATSALAQVAATQNAPDRTLTVFLDCESFVCDGDYLRREIDWVDWVRDREVADVHVLVVTQSTGGGGQRVELTFLGRGTFAGKADTLAAALRAAATNDDARRMLAQRLGLGLVGYAAGTAMGQRLEISLPEGDEGEDDGATAADDPWDYWVFSVSGNGFFNGEVRQKYRSLYGTASARRITAEWKIALALNGSDFRSDFELEDRTATSIRRDYGVNALVANSVGPNWSAGVRLSANSASFVNQDLSFRIGPAVEYNIFPYDESSRRQLTFRYAVGRAYFDYAEETAYGRLSERLIEHQFATSVSFEQPWGDVSTTIELSHYPRWAPGPNAPPELAAGGPKYRGVLFTSVDVSLFEGLSLTLSGSYQRIHDQIYLERGDATDEDVLLRIRQLQTNYRYYGSVGLRYTFGSIYNSVVNPRFGSSSAGGVIFSF